MTMTHHMLAPFIEQWFIMHSTLPVEPFDPAWPSPCIMQTTPDENEWVTWQPVEQTTKTDMFARLSAALDVEIHPTLIEFYSGYWSAPLSATTTEGELTLLQVWNNDDWERLRANLIGHALNKRQLKHPLTLFFACTVPDDGILSVMNHDGTVWLEYPGKRPIKQIAESLPALMARISPCSMR